MQFLRNQTVWNCRKVNVEAQLSKCVNQSPHSRCAGLEPLLTGLFFYYYLWFDKMNPIYLTWKCPTLYFITFFFLLACCLHFSIMYIKHCTVAYTQCPRCHLQPSFCNVCSFVMGVVNIEIKWIDSNFNICPHSTFICLYLASLSYVKLQRFF